MPRPSRFTPGKDPVPTVGGPQALWTIAESLAPPPGFDPRTVQPVANRVSEQPEKNVSKYLVKDQL